MSVAARLDLLAERAQGSVLVVLAGPLVSPQPGWLPPLRRVLERSHCAVAVPALVPAGGHEEDAAAGLEVDRLLTETPWGSVGGTEPFEVASGSLAAMVVRRDAFRAVGGFDAGLRAAGEDVDLCLRLRRCGWTVRAVPEAKVTMDFETLPADPVDLLADTLRLGAVHLGRAALSDQVRALADVPGVSAALTRVVLGDAGRRRSRVGALSWFASEELTVPAPVAGGRAGRESE